MYYEISNLQHLFSAMKREGWTPEYITERIDVYLQRIKDDENFKYKISRKGGFKKGDYKPAYEEEITDGKVMCCGK